MIAAILSDLQIYYLNTLNMFCLIEWVCMKAFHLYEDTLLYVRHPDALAMEQTSTVPALKIQTKKANPTHTDRISASMNWSSPTDFCVHVSVYSG